MHIRAGEGDGSLAACLARGLGVEFITTRLEVCYSYCSCYFSFIFVDFILPALLLLLFFSFHS